MALAEQREEMPRVGDAALSGDESDRFLRRYQQMTGVAFAQLDEQVDHAGAEMGAEQALDRRRAG